MPDEKPISLEDIRKACEELAAVMPGTPDWHILLPNEAMPDVVRTRLQWAVDHVYYSGNIEHNA